MSEIYLEYWNGSAWVPAGGPYFNESLAWVSLGCDDINYRTVSSDGDVLTDKRPTGAEGQRGC